MYIKTSATSYDTGRETEILNHKILVDIKALAY